jgi:hypothetical protein
LNLFASLNRERRRNARVEFKTLFGSGKKISRGERIKYFGFPYKRSLEAGEIAQKGEQRLKFASPKKHWKRF